MSQGHSTTAMVINAGALNAAVRGTTIGIGVRRLTEGMMDKPARLKLVRDDQSCVAISLHDVTSWRSIHYAQRSATIIDMIAREGMTVAHIRGTWMLADPLTTVRKMHTASCQCQVAARTHESDNAW